MFDGKVVVVTGAGRGIGRRIALTYAAHGARVVIADVDAGAGRETESLVRDRGGEGAFVAADVRRPGDVRAVMQEAVRRYETVHILINNAGIACWKSPYELTVEEWDDVLSTNLRGAFLCAREAAAAMRDRGGGGAIVNIASTRAIMSESNSEAYAASKGGLLALTGARPHPGQRRQPGLDRDGRLPPAPARRPRPAPGRARRQAGGRGPGVPVPHPRRQRLPDGRQHRPRRRHDAEDDLRGLKASPDRPGEAS